MTLDQEFSEAERQFREAKNWFVEHKRDPFLWLVILGPLVLATFTLWGVVIFPMSDAMRAIRQVLPNDVNISIDDMSFWQKNFPSCRAKKYVFGYDFTIWKPKFINGRICRDVVNGGWVLDIDPRYEKLQSR